VTEHRHDDDDNDNAVSGSHAIQLDVQATVQRSSAHMNDVCVTAAFVSVFVVVRVSTAFITGVLPDRSRATLHFCLYRSALLSVCLVISLYLFDRCAALPMLAMVDRTCC